MEEDNYNNDNETLIDVLLILGIIILGISNSDGWGWLIFILILRNL